MRDEQRDEHRDELRDEQRDEQACEGQLAPRQSPMRGGRVLDREEKKSEVK